MTLQESLWEALPPLAPACIARGRVRIISSSSQDLLDLALSNTDIRSFEQRQAKRIIHHQTIRLIDIVSRNSDCLHGFQDALNRGLGTVDLGLIGEFGFACFVEVVASFPGEVAGCFEAHFHADEEVCHALVLDCGAGAAALFGCDDFEGVFEAGSHLVRHVSVCSSEFGVVTDQSSCAGTNQRCRLGESRDVDDSTFARSGKDVFDWDTEVGEVCAWSRMGLESYARSSVLAETTGS